MKLLQWTKHEMSNPLRISHNFLEQQKKWYKINYLKRKLNFSAEQKWYFTCTNIFPQKLVILETTIYFAF